MKTLYAWAVLGAFTFLIASCAGKAAPAGTEASATAAATYTCPSCKENVSWVYGSWPESPKGAITARKVVTHECPSCKKEWSGNLSTTTTCAVCVEQHLGCPACKAHGG